MVGWRRKLAVCVAVVACLSSARAGAECTYNDCRRFGASFGARDFVYGNAWDTKGKSEKLNFFYTNVEIGLGGPYVAMDFDTAIASDLKLFGPALVLRAPIDLIGSGKHAALQLEPTLGLGMDMWFWSAENRSVKGISLRLSPRIRLVWNATHSFAMTADLLWAEILPMHYSWGSGKFEHKSDHVWLWMNFGVGIYYRF
jgi:hypothetical protein